MPPIAPCKTTRGPVALIALLLLGLTACTHRTSGPPPSGTVPPSGPTPTISVAPGTTVYRYVNEGLTATMELEGHRGTLQIDNGTGRELPKPGFYVLDAVDGHRIDGTVDRAAEVPDGRSETFTVSLGSAEPKDIGLLVLLMGHDNYGAFVKQ
jgi:hypothetical protein